MALDQKALESLSGPQQIIVMQSLKQEAAAWLLGVNVRTLREKAGTIERHADDSYNAREVFAGGLSTGVLKVEPPKLSPDQEEKCIRSAELLSEAVSPPVLRLIRELEERHGVRGLAEFVKLLRETWIERGITEAEPQWPSEDQLRRQIESQVEERLRLAIEGTTEAQLKLGTECEHCGKVRRGRKWIKTETTDSCFLGSCPDCGELRKQQRPRRKKRRSDNATALAVALMADDE